MMSYNWCKMSYNFFTKMLYNPMIFRQKVRGHPASSKGLMLMSEQEELPCWWPHPKWACLLEKGFQISWDQIPPSVQPSYRAPANHFTLATLSMRKILEMWISCPGPPTQWAYRLNFRYQQWNFPPTPKMILLIHSGMSWARILPMYM